MKQFRSSRKVQTLLWHPTACVLFVCSACSCVKKVEFQSGFSAIASVDYDDATVTEKTITDGNVSVVIQRLKRPLRDGYPDESMPSFHAIAYRDGRLVGAFKNIFDKCLLQIAEMDSSNPYREVLASCFTGGATGCCNQVQVLTSDPLGENWKVVETELHWGPSAAEKPLENRPFVLINEDSQILYDDNLSECENRRALFRILELRGSAFVDVRSLPEYNSLVLKHTACGL